MSTEVTISSGDYQTNTTYGEQIYNYDSYDYDFDYGDEIMYPGFDFERAFYLHLWEIVVVIISIVNIIVISVLLRKKMRNATNIILAAIAVSDSLTGLVTLPTYIMVYQRYQPLEFNNYSTYDYGGNSNGDGDAFDDTKSSYNYDKSGINTFFTTTYPFAGRNQSNVSTSSPMTDIEDVDAYVLTEDLCEAFMISKLFLSKWFHTVSIFLTLFLALQRYVSVAFPYKSQFLFNTKRTVISCVLVFVLSPILHVYHLTKEKTMEGMCQWEIHEQGCGGTCIYLWIAFFLRHFIPCVTLIVLSVMFVAHLRLGEKTLRRSVSNSSQISRRSEENRRISLIVTAIVVIFLVPEIPYSIFLLYNAVDKAVFNGKNINMRTNRIIQLVYDIALVLSFHANVYIYVLFNKRFRKILYRTIVKPVRRFIGDTRRLSITQTSSASHVGSAKKPMHTNSTKVSQDANRLDFEKSKDALEMQPLNDKT